VWMIRRVVFALCLVSSSWWCLLGH
jgi:hypothetical protein